MIESQGRQADWRRANPSKYEAHLAVGRALKTGELAKQPCEVCGAEAVDAHHDDYQQPLQVRWLCRLHHTRLHAAGEDMFPEGKTNWDVWGKAAAAVHARKQAGGDAP